MKPFEEHTGNLAAYEQMLGGGDPLGCAVLKIFNKDIPVTHTEIVTDFELEYGKSSTTFVERCEFLASDIGAAQPAKGVPCTLKPNPAARAMAMQLWRGGLQPGGEVYRFMLVDANYLA